MWPLIIGALAGGALGAANTATKQKEANAQRIIEMAKARWGPLANGALGQAQYVGMPDMLSGVASGAINGASFGQGIGNFMNDKEQAQQRSNNMENQSDAMMKQIDTMQGSNFGTRGQGYGMDSGPFGAQQSWKPLALGYGGGYSGENK